MANSDKVTIHIDGVAEFVKACRKAGDRDSLNAVKAGNREAAEVVAKEAKVIVPRKSGKLGRSIRANASIKRGVVAAGRASLPYAGPIHFGWAAHNIKPQPFIYDAADKRANDVRKAYEEQIINRVVGPF